MSDFWKNIISTALKILVIAIEQFTGTDINNDGKFGF